MPTAPRRSKRVSPAPRLIETPRKRTVSADRGDEHDDTDDGGGGCGRLRPRRADVPTTQARGGIAPAPRRGPGAGVALAGRDGGDTLELARGFSCCGRHVVARVAWMDGL